MSTERSQQNAGLIKLSDESLRASGTVQVVAVPIGHPDDITLRALQVLREVDLIVSEDPVATRSLLKHHGIEATLTHYGPHHLEEKVTVLLHRLRRGARIALVSDCGSPVIDDPGCLLVAAAHEHGIPVMSVPGPSAITAALALSGFAGDAFCFYGRLPRSPSAVRRRLDALLSARETTVAFCPPESVGPVLDTIAQSAPRRRLVLAGDLTGPVETVLRGTAPQVRTELARRPAPSQVTLIIAGDKKRRDTGGKKRR